MIKIDDITRLYGVNRDSFSEFLPYRMWDAENQCFENYDKTIGWMWELAPLPFAGDASMKTLESIFRLSLPPEATTQFILFADPRIKPIVDDFLRLRDTAVETKTDWKIIGSVALSMGLLTEEQNNEILADQEISGMLYGEIAVRLGYLTQAELDAVVLNQKGTAYAWSQNYAAYLSKHTAEGFYNDVPVPVRHFRLFLCVKIPFNNYAATVARYANMRDAIEGDLNTSYFAPERVGPNGLLGLVRYFLNPKYYAREDNISGAPYNSDQWLNDQIIRKKNLIRWEPKLQKTSLEIDETQIGAYSVASFPKELDVYDTLYLVGDIFRQNLEQVLSPFMISMTFVNKDYNPGILRKATIMLAQKSSSIMGPKLHKKQEEFHRALYSIEDKTQFRGMMVSVVTFNETEEKKDLNGGVLKNLWKQQGYDLQNEGLIPVPVFLASLPFGLPNNKLTRTRLKRIVPAPVQTISECAPIQADWRGFGIPAFLMVSRRGQLMALDLFSSNSNYNACCCAPAGSGKSFFLNFLIMAYRALGVVIRIIDVGKSYERIVECEGGQILEFDRSKNICINPFTITTDINEDMALLSPLIQKMAKPVEGCDDYEANCIDQAIRIVWNKYGTKGRISRVAEHLLSEADPVKIKLGQLLTPFGPGERYSQWFEGDANIEMSGVPIQLLELDHLNNDKRLRTLVLIFVLYQTAQLVYLGDRSKRTILIVDEAWDLFGDSEAAGIGGFLETFYRKCRKYNGAIVTITQALSDYNKNDSTTAMLNNSAWWFLLKQKSEEIQLATQAGRIPDSKFMQQYISSVHTLKRKYSEVYIKCDDTSGIGRLFVDPYSYALFTTDGNETAYMDREYAKSQSWALAAQAAVATHFGKN